MQDEDTRAGRVAGEVDATGPVASRGLFEHRGHGLRVGLHLLHGLLVFERGVSCRLSVRASCTPLAAPASRSRRFASDSTTALSEAV